MSVAYFVFYGRLNDFLQRDRREKNITVQFRGRQSIKHLAESLGVPHPEIGRIQVNDQDEALNRITQDDDHVEVHPVENGCPVEPRLLLDCHLGRLTGHLRMLGFDSLYENDYEDSQLAEIAWREERILLTRDRRLLMRKEIRYGYCLRSLNHLEQLEEVLHRFELKNRIEPFHRCLRCNHPLESVDKGAILDRLEPLTKKYFEEFQICPACGQIYWKGSHYKKMQIMIEQINDIP